jgi:hypothetical protein
MSAIPIVHPVYQRTFDAIDAFMTETCPNLLVDLATRKFSDRLRHVAVMIDAFYETFDTVLGEHIAEDAPAKGYSVSCQSGCSHCCHREVRASLSEIIGAVVYLNENPEIKDAFLKRFSRGSSCSFLSNNMCSIYPMRPVECRELVSLDDPSKCANDFSGSPVMMASNFAEAHKSRTLDAIAGVVVNGFGLDALPVGRFDAQVYFLLSKGASYFDRIRSFSA